MSTPVEKIAGLTIGAVESAAPNELRVVLAHDSPSATALNAGLPQGFPRINGYVLIPNEAGALVGLVSRVAIAADRLSAADSSSGPILRLGGEKRSLTISPIGTLEMKRPVSGEGVQLRLRRGVTVYPSVGDPVLLPTPDQLRAVVEASGEDTRVQIGTAPYANDARVTIDPDKLFGRHLAVFGNTGSGKSCSVAGLIRWSIEEAAKNRKKKKRNVNARFIVLDPNGEYLSCFEDLSDRVNLRVFSVEPPSDSKSIERLFVPAWMWNAEEWATLLLAQPGAQRPVLMQALRLARDAARRGSRAVDATGDGDDAALPTEADLSVVAVVRGCKDWLLSLLHGETKAYGAFPGSKNVHQQLEQQADYVESKANLISEAAAVGAASYVSKLREVRARRTNGQYLNGFGPDDLEEMANSAQALLDHFPGSIVTPPTERGAPARFDPTRLPEIIESVAVARGGNVAQTVDFLKLRLESMLADDRLAQVIAAPEGDKDFPAWLEAIIGPSNDNGCGQITVLDLSLVPSDALATIISVIARIVFEVSQRHRRLPNAGLMPTTLVLEEAHNFVQRESSAGDEAMPARRCRQSFEKIAKEGRKFGLGLVLSSQRPAELSPTVVAQCNSFLLHRIVNDRDQDLIRRLIPDNAGSVLGELPTLPSQQAVLLGLAAEVPVIVDIKYLPKEHCPRSENPRFWDTWTGENELHLDYRAICEAWRQ